MPTVGSAVVAVDTRTARLLAEVRRCALRPLARRTAKRISTIAAKAAAAPGGAVALTAASTAKTKTAGRKHAHY